MFEINQRVIVQDPDVRHHEPITVTVTHLNGDGAAFQYRTDDGRARWTYTARAKEVTSR